MSYLTMFVGFVLLGFADVLAGGDVFMTVCFAIVGIAWIAVGVLSS